MLVLPTPHICPGLFLHPSVPLTSNACPPPLRHPSTKVSSEGALAEAPSLPVTSHKVRSGATGWFWVIASQSIGDPGATGPMASGQASSTPRPPGSGSARGKAQLGRGVWERSPRTVLAAEPGEVPRPATSALSPPAGTTGTCGPASDPRWSMARWMGTQTRNAGAANPPAGCRGTSPHGDETTAMTGLTCPRRGDRRTEGGAGRLPWGSSPSTHTQRPFVPEDRKPQDRQTDRQRRHPPGG